MPLPHSQSSQDIFICKTKRIKYIRCSYYICVTNAAFFTLTWFTKLHMNSQVDPSQHFTVEPGNNSKLF